MSDRPGKLRRLFLISTYNHLQSQWYSVYSVCFKWNNLHLRFNIPVIRDGRCIVLFLLFIFCLWKWLTILLSLFSPELTIIACLFSFMARCSLPSFLRASCSKFPTWLFKQFIPSWEVLFSVLSSHWLDAQPVPELSCCFSDLVVLLGVFGESIHYCNKSDHLLPILIQGQ